MVILLKGKKYYKKHKSLFNVILSNVNLFTKILNFKFYVNMASSFWRPWEHHEQETSAIDETETH